MDEEALNLSVRKFLKKVGVTAQREIEGAFREAVARGQMASEDAFMARATIEVAAIQLTIVVEGELRLTRTGREDE